MHANHASKLLRLILRHRLEQLPGRGRRGVGITSTPLRTIPFQELCRILSGWTTAMEVETPKDASQKTIRRVAPDVQNVFTQYQYPTHPERCLHGHAKEESPANPKSIPCPQHPGRKPLRRPALCFPSKRSQLYFPVEVLTICACEIQTQSGNKQR